MESISDKVIKSTIDNGRCLVKVTKANKKEVYALVAECEIDITLRAVSWGCGKDKYVLFVDACAGEQEGGKVLTFKRKSV